MTGEALLAIGLQRDQLRFESSLSILTSSSSMRAESVAEVSSVSKSAPSALNWLIWSVRVMIC